MPFSSFQRLRATPTTVRCAFLLRLFVTRQPDLMDFLCEKQISFFVVPPSLSLSLSGRAFYYSDIFSLSLNGYQNSKWLTIIKWWYNNERGHQMYIRHKHNCRRRFIFIYIFLFLLCVIVCCRRAIVSLCCRRRRRRSKLILSIVNLYTNFISRKNEIC